MAGPTKKASTPAQEGAAAGATTSAASATVSEQSQAGVPTAETPVPEIPAVPNAAETPTPAVPANPVATEQAPANAETSATPPASVIDEPAAPVVVEQVQQASAPVVAVEEAVEEVEQLRRPSIGEDGLHRVLTELTKKAEAEGDHAAHAALHVIETMIGELRYKCGEAAKVLKDDALDLVQMLKESL